VSPVPAFEISVWNAWIFMAAWVFSHNVPLTWPIFRYDIKAMFKKAIASPSYTKTEKKINALSTVIFFLLLIYSVFLPLPLGTAWFYTGLALFLIGSIITEVVKIHWATTPLDQPITRGLYRYSRHPAYVAPFLQFIGVGIASASWLFLLLSVVSIVVNSVLVIPEERFCLEKYGDAYREYMSRTPRWIGIPKSEPK